MARPRKDAEGPSARARIIDAFWRLVRTCPAHELSAAAVAEAACVNRGTFYYHFPDMDALVSCAVREEILRDDALPDMLLALFVQDDGELLAHGIPRSRLRRAALIMRAGEMHTVVAAVREAMHIRWRDALYPAGGELAPASTFAIQFMVSGLLGHIAYAVKADDKMSSLFVFGPIERTYMRAVVRETVRAVAHAEGLEEDAVVERICGVKRAQPA